MNIEPSTYRPFLIQLKEKIQISQIKASLKVNKELLKLYFFIEKNSFNRII